jgi:hypothetical protein
VALHYGRHPRQLFETHDRKPHRLGRLAPGLCHDLAGFGVRVYPNGRKQRFVTLGRYGEMTVHEARTEAMAVLLSVRRGEDPSGDRIAYRNSPTMEDLAERHMREHLRPRKKP